MRFLGEKASMANKFMKICSTSVIIRNATKNEMPFYTGWKKKGFFSNPDVSFKKEDPPTIYPSPLVLPFPLPMEMEWVTGLRGWGAGWDPHFPPECNLSKTDLQRKEFCFFLLPSSPGPEWSSSLGKRNYTADSILPWVGCSRLSKFFSALVLTPIYCCLILHLLGPLSYFSVGQELGQERVVLLVGLPQSLSINWQKWKTKQKQKQNNNTKCSRESRAAGPLCAADERINGSNFFREKLSTTKLENIDSLRPSSSSFR